MSLVFDPDEYIEVQLDGSLRCINPDCISAERAISSWGQLASLTLQPGMMGEEKRRYERLIKQWAMEEKISPGFSVVILRAAGLITAGAA